MKNVSRLPPALSITFLSFVVNQLSQPSFGADDSADLRSNDCPNFVFFITDDISPDDLSVYGNTSVETPKLAEIAARGLVFDNAYLTISSCSPSRCSIITGRYPHNTGAPILHSPLPSDQRTFIQDLRAAGYHTLLSGKNHMATPQQLGFEASSNSKPAGSENWLRHLSERPKDRPFFFWFASHDAHHPFPPHDKAPTYDSDNVAAPPMLYDGPLTREELANYYPAATTADMKALRYLTAPNHVVSDRKSKNPDIGNGGPMYRMTPHGHRCCQHNHSHGWPYYAEHLWLATADNGLCAMLYSASNVTVNVADGDRVTLNEETHYPFDDRISIGVSVERPVKFPLYLRVPNWCDAPVLKINDESVAADSSGGD